MGGRASRSPSAARRRPSERHPGDGLTAGLCRSAHARGLLGRWFACTISGLLLAVPAHAGPVLDRVAAAHGVTCGAEERAGIAEIEGDGSAAGLAVDLCRAIAVAVLGPDARITFTVLAAARDFDALRAGRFDLAFLSTGTLLGERLADRLLPGPVVYAREEALMVPERSPVRELRDLAGKSVCFMIGSGAERALEAELEREHVAIERSGYQEDVELRDAYNVGRCVAVAGDASFLAEVRQDGGVHGLRSRILARALALDPLYLVTGLEDARWSALSAWTVATLLLAAVPPSAYSGQRPEPLAAAVAPLGLRPDWFAEVSRAVGTYADIRRRNLGGDSDLRLAPGPNAPWPEGLLPAPSSP